MTVWSAFLSAVMQLESHTDVVCKNAFYGTTIKGYKQSVSVLFFLLSILRKVSPLLYLLDVHSLTDALVQVVIYVKIQKLED